MADLTGTLMISVCVAATRPDTIATTIRSIRTQAYPHWELVLVAQGQVAAVQQVALAETQAEPKRLRFIAQTGFGLSRARNAAMRAATGDVFAWLDDDCEAASDWLSVIAEAVTQRPQLGLVGGALIAPPPPHHWPRTCPAWTPGEALHDPGTNGNNRPPGFGWLGGNFALTREAVDRIGPFDEYLGAGGYFPQSEDVDYMLRAESAGIPMLSTPRAIVYHTHGWRYGIGPVMRHQRNLARGSGALAGKLTLLGDPRGERLLGEARREVLAEGTRWWRRPISAATAARRLRHFVRAYRECVTGFSVASDGRLTPRPFAAGVAHQPVEREPGVAEPVSDLA
jgi:hypothetical protein